MVISLGLFFSTISLGAGGCQESYESLRYREAVDACMAEVATAAPEVLPALYRTLALSFAALEDRDRARAAFASLLALDPSASLPPTVSPKLRGPLEEARRLGTPVRAHLSAQPVDPPRVGRPLVLRATVEDGAARPVTRVVARAAEMQTAAERKDGPMDMSLGVPARSGPLVADVTALDRFGGRLARLRLSLDIAPSRPPRPALLSWKAWGVAGVVLAALAVGAGWWSGREGEAARKATFADRADERATNARTASYVANVGFGLAAVLGAGGMALFVTRPPEEP